MLLAALYPRRKKRGTTLLVSRMNAISKNGTQSSKVQTPKPQVTNHTAQTPKTKAKAKSKSIGIFKSNHKV
jgi:SLT domain-containing protein